MGIDAKTVQDFVRGVVKFSMDACCKCVEKHPFVFGVVLGFFLLYFLIPSVFYFLLFTSPVVFCIVVSIKIYSATQNCKLQQISVKRVDEKSFVESKSPLADHHVVSRSGDKTVIQSRRRNFKDKNNEWDAEGGKKEQKSRRTPIDAPIAENQKLVMDEGEISNQNAATAENIQAPEDLFNETSLNEEKLKETNEEKESSSLDRGESPSGNATAGGDAQALEQHQPTLYSQPSMVDLIHDELVDQSENIGIGGGEVEVESSSDDAEDEEEAQQERNKAVEWTEDDQQNLMDLGDSELERNKRLESLIARRRARKLFRMAVEKRVIDPGCGSQGQIAPISILRSTLLNCPSNESLEGPHTPGSAPSVMLPSRNPFDIPYDPLEEKPNLMSDSFQQEFSAAHRKDMFFPKHEGLCWGPSFSLESQQDQNNSKSCSYADGKKHEERLRFSRFRTFSDMSAHDQLIDNYLCQGQALFRMLSATDLVEVGSQASKQSKKAEELKAGDKEPGTGMAGIKEETDFQDVESRSTYRSEVHGDTNSARDHSSELVHEDTDSARDHSSEQCSPASDDASELSFHGNLPTHTEILEARPGKFPQKLSDRVQNSLTFSVPENIAYNGTAYDSSPSPVYKPKLENRFFFRDKMPCPSPVYSIASDLQVEVSELGSPPLPPDGAMSPADIESLYDGDVEREMIFGSEEMFGASSHLSGIDEYESRSREVNEVREDDIVQVGFSAIKQNLQDQTSSFTSPEHVTDQDMSSTSTLSSSRNIMPEKDEAHSKNPNNKISENVKQLGEEVHRVPKLSDALPPKIPQKHLHPMKESVLCGVYSEKPQELSNPPQKAATEGNAVFNAGDQVVHPKNDDIATKNIALTDVSQPAEKITSESSKHIENNSTDMPAEQKTVSEPEEETKENKRTTFIETDPGEPNEPEDVGEMSKTTKARDSLLSVQDSKDEQCITVGVSGVIQRHIENNSIDKPAEQKMVLEPQEEMKENKSTTFIETNPGEPNEPEDVGEMSKITEARDSLLSVQDSKDEQSITVGVSGAIQRYIENNSIDKPAEQKTVSELEEETKENKSTTFIGRDPGEPNEPEDVGEMSKKTKARDNLLSVQDSKDEQSITVGVSGVNPRHIENNSTDKPAEQKTVSEAQEETKENKSTTFIGRDPGEPNEPEDVGEMSKITEARDSLLSVQDSKDEQSITEGVSGVNQSYDNPIVHPRQPMAFISEQISARSSSCSSPRSVLPGNIPKDQIPSSHVDRQVNANVQRTIVDGIVRNNSGYEVEPESLPQTAPQDSQHWVVNPLKYPSTSSSSGLSEEPSVEVVEGKSEPVISPVAATVKSEDAHETDPGPVDHIEGKSQTVPDCKAGISSLEPEEKIENSDFPETIVKEEETPNCSEKSTTEANNISDPAVNKKEDKEELKSVEGSKNEPQLPRGKLTENEVTVGPSNSIEGNENYSASKAREDIMRFTEQVTSEDDLEAGNPIESKNIMEYEASKPTITAAETASQEAPSHPVQQNIMHTLIEMSDKITLIDPVNFADQPEPIKAIAEGDTMYNMKETETGANDNMSNNNKENFADQPKTSNATTQFDILQNANETLGNETGSMNSLIDQEQIAEQPSPVKSPTEVDVMHNMSETLHTEMSNKEKA
ncbi:hypothetical protein Patl1_31147 [Pistacia atlantica]|uniref:Uncharacterized protein n=1 Tax=Pistacia atlantica TaxID=434234 RepID=A0ACC1ACV4_9ROSI|nr:hypothetical protein Patl1_31147 [Pistacia atlantica]